MAFRVTKTEHAGAKNGGGHWGTRAEAKQHSNRRRRQDEEFSALLKRVHQEYGEAFKKLADR
jgi:hypothetical protein